MSVLRRSIPALQRAFTTILYCMLDVMYHPTVPSVAIAVHCLSCLANYLPIHRRSLCSLRVACQCTMNFTSKSRMKFYCAPPVD